MAHPVNVPQTVNDLITQQLFQKQRYRIAMIGNGDGFLPFLAVRLNCHLRIRHTDTLNQPLAEHVALRHLQQLEF
ncbi:Uncharacterised protein [Salmonella enterica subsp. enterica serovar Bovismorbificans]|uniref:Uncharacterized protein n=1 Tax=Salmonella enterica subsp. enterica serovar Bovismorbificans TaxID=58097 RepID=A0A655DVS3_SALET|nr:Uncharacterised protein [Salmonella enterica subsp. enterica serovar Bovismorbificans]